LTIYSWRQIVTRELKTNFFLFAVGKQRERKKVWLTK
jgi:hypothetical protein